MTDTTEVTLKSSNTGYLAVTLFADEEYYVY